MTVNEEIRDIAVGHSIWLYRYESGQVNDLLKQLEKLDQELTEKLRKYGDSLITKSRFEKIQKYIKEYIEEGKRILDSKLSENLDYITEEESRWVEKVLESSIPSEIGINIRYPSISQIKTAINEMPFENRLLSELSKNWTDNKKTAFTNAVKYGFMTGQTVSQILDVLFGTSEFNFKNGLNHKSYNNLKIEVRTGLQHMAYMTRKEMYKANNDLIKGEQWVATLDTRTTPLCISLDGKVRMFDGSKNELGNYNPPAHLRM